MDKKAVDSGEKMDKELLEIFFMANREKTKRRYCFRICLPHYLLEGMIIK